MRPLILALPLLALALAQGAAAQTKEGKPDAGFTQMPIEQEGTAHGTPRSTGETPKGDGSTVVKQGTGTDNDQQPATTSAKPCDPASPDCPGADVRK